MGNAASVAYAEQAEEEPSTFDEEVNRLEVMAKVTHYIVCRRT